MKKLSEIVTATRNFLQRRATAYRACFPRESPTTDTVLADLAHFCRAGRSTFHADPHVAARLDGRREVFLRIVQHLQLSSDELMALYAAGLRKENPG